MSGCFGCSAEDRARERELHSYLKSTTTDDALEQRVEDRARDKFFALPDFYTKPNDRHRWTNMDDCIGEVKQEELISIARAIRDGDNKLAGDILAASLMRICINHAEYEIEDEND